LGLLIALLAASCVFYIKQQLVSTNTEYVGSQRCLSCHFDEHNEWFSSLHSKMMRKLSTPGVLEADFNVVGVAFDPEQAVWAIGSKWEQQFMGVQDGREVLLPGAWMKATRSWKTQGWDGWTVPDPVRRCHGCHTVGLNINTGEFIEPSVGCESCHGPGDWHVLTKGLGGIASGVDAQICGQCHTRGHSKDGALFFPYGYKPGARLDSYFDEIKPYAAQNTSQWWRNGHPRKRHQEYYSWRQGGHVNSLKSLKGGYDGKYGQVTSKCLGCHAGEAINDGQSEHYTLEEVEYGITCAVCHNVHGKLEQLRLSCSSCHGEGASYHQPEINPNHIPCPESAEVQCEQCHMPLTVMNGGGYTLHSHRAGIISPDETRKSGVPGSCANGGCHKDKSIDWLQAAFDKNYRVVE